MKPQAFVVIPEAYPPALNVLGVQITVLADRARTGAYEVTLQQGTEGVGPPPHRHAWDESFFVLDRTVEITSGDQSFVCRAGTLVHVPAGATHGYQFGPGGGRMVELSQGQADAVGATRMFSNVARDLPAGPPAMPQVVQVLANNGVTLADAA